MAAPITHLVLAEKVFAKYFSDKDKLRLMVGTSFPDIRYLGVIDREKTHYHNLDISKVRAEESFIAGMQFHSLVDEVREAFVVKMGLYDLFPKSELIFQSVKNFEDKVLYEKVSDWSEVETYFNQVLEEETNFGINESDVVRWHQLLTSYISIPPQDKSLYEFVSNLGRPVQMAEEIKRVVNGVSDLSKAKDIVNEFYDNFEDLVGETPERILL